MAKRKLLIADDSKFFRYTCRKYLETLDAEIVEAESGDQAMEYIKKQHFDLVMSDVEMPGMSGLEFCEALKKSPETRSIPVILISALDSEKEIERGFRSGASAYLPKNFTVEKLKDTVLTILDKNLRHREQLILIVDDSLTIRSVISKGLAEAGFQTMVAGNGQEALDLMASIRPHLIMSDINMPVMDGRVFCERVRANADWHSIPFVTMSTETDRGVMLHMRQRGAVAYLVKPVNIDQIVLTIEKILDDNFLFLYQEKEKAVLAQHLTLAGIASLVQALETRDEYTRGHTERVSALCDCLAEQLKIDAELREDLCLSALLHDIGKIGIRDSILLKPDKLSDTEFTVIKSHPSMGADILKPIPNLERVIPAVLHHHEKFNGLGYPQKLKGEAIPFFSRIIAVADTFDALTSNRPYRKGMDTEKAMGIIAEERGKQLCPQCVDAFQAVHDRDPAALVAVHDYAR